MESLRDIIDSGSDALAMLRNNGAMTRDRLLDTIKTFTSARLVHADEVSELYDSLLTALKQASITGTIDLSGFDFDDIQDKFIVDTYGKIHQFSVSMDELRIYTGSEYVKIADHVGSLDDKTFQFVDEEMEYCAGVFMEACEDVLDTSGAYLEYIDNLTNATYNSSDYMSAIVQDGLNSSIIEIRELASDLANHSVDEVPATLFSYLKNGLSGVASSGTLQTDAEQNWTFSLSDYSANSAKNILASGWSLLSNAAGIIASVALMCGKPLLAGITTAISAITTAVSKVQTAVHDYTYFKTGTGTSSEYANGSILTLKGFTNACKSRLNQPGVGIDTPWGRVYVEQPGGEDDGALHSVEEVKMLIKPNATVVPYSAMYPMYFQQSSNMVTLYPRSDLDYTDFFDFARSNDLLDNFYMKSNITAWQETGVISYVIANMSNLVWWLAQQIFINGVWESIKTAPHATSILSSVMTLPIDASQYSQSTVSSIENAMKSCGLLLAVSPPLDITDTPTASLDPYQNGAHAAVYNWLYNLTDRFAPMDAFFANGSSLEVVSAIQLDINKDVQGTFSCAELLNYYYTVMYDVFASAWSSAGGSVSDQPTMPTIVAKGMALFFNRLFQHSAISSGPLSIYPTLSSNGYINGVQYVFDDYAVVTSGPKLTTDPWVSPPTFTRSSIKRMAILVTVGSVVAVAAFALIKRAAKKRRMRKAIEQEAKLDSAMKAYQADPTKSNAKQLFKESRRYSRKARRAGYSSNSVGTFDCYNRTSAQRTESILESFSADDSTEANNELLYAVRQVITGS